MDIQIIILFLLGGILGGFLAGMLGVGGGIVFVPLIQIVLEKYQIINDTDFVNYTLANSLTIVLVIGIFGTIKHYKNKNTHIPSALIIGLSAIVVSLGITLLVKYFNLQNEKLFKGIFVTILAATALKMILGLKKTKTETTLNLPSKYKLIPAGIFTGFVTALSGLGGGVVMVPYFTNILKMPIKFATGLSVTVIPLIALPLLIFYSFEMPTQIIYQKYQMGYILLPLVLPIITGAVFATSFGIKTAQKLNEKTITIIFLSFVLITILKVLIF